MKHFEIYLDNGESKQVEAPSLRKAVRDAEKGIGKARIIAAIDVACLPPPASAEQPFRAVFLRNPGFTPPEIE